MAGLLNDQESDWEPSYGLLGLASGLMQPTRGGSFSEALGNGAQGWASGSAMGRKLKQQDVATALEAIKAQLDRQRLQHQAQGQWSLTPYVDANNDVYRFHTDGRVEKLGISGKYQPNMQVNAGGETQIISPNNPTVPKAIIPHTQTPDQQAENTPHFEPTDVNGRPGQRNTLTGETKLYPDGPQMPGNIRSGIESNRAMVRNIDATIADLEAHPDALGLAYALPGAERLGQKFDKDGILARAGVSDVGSMLLHDRSGASVTVSEAPRLKAFVPAISDTKDAAIAKLTRLKKIVEEEANAMESAYQPVRADSGNTHFNFSNRAEAERLYNSMENGPEREALGKQLGKTSEPSAPTSIHRVIGPDGKPHIATLRDGKWEIQ